METLKEIISLVKAIPENYLEETLLRIKEIKEKSEAEEKNKKDATKCPHCNSTRTKRNGRKHNKQSYWCHECKKSFVETSKSAIQNSHSSVTVWKQIISDTVAGVPIDKTADSLNMHHETVFNMRHKILYCVEQSLIKNPTELTGVCETDETYVLESEKGRKFSENHHRKPRKHGAKAIKSGLSNEYVCVCTSVAGTGQNVAVSVNRATPTNQEILDVFGSRVNSDTVILCDGAKSYDVLDDKCTVAHTKRVNKVNGFHSFIKERLDSMHGVATIYLNRYNSLFSMIYATDKSVVDDIFEMLTAQSGYFNTIEHTLSDNLLIL